MTKKVLRRLRESLEEEEFAQNRHRYVTKTIEDFQDLKPSVLDIVFDYKIEDLTVEKEEVKDCIAYQRISGQTRLPVTKKVKRK